MFFPFTDYKTVSFDHSTGSSGVKTVYTTTAKSMISFVNQYESAVFNNIHRVYVKDYIIPVNLLFDFVLEDDGFGGISIIGVINKTIIVPAGHEIQTQRGEGVLHIFELPE